MFLHFLCCLITLSSIIVQAFEYNRVGGNDDLVYSQVAEKSMNVIKMSEIQPVIDELSAKEGVVESSAKAIIKDNDDLGPGAAGKKPVPRSPNTGLYMFNTCVQFNSEKTKAAHIAAGKEYNPAALKLAHFDAFKVEKGAFLKIGWVLFNIDLHTPTKRKAGVVYTGEASTLVMPVLAGTVGGSPLSNELLVAAVAGESGVEGKMIAKAFDYRCKKVPPRALYKAIKGEDGEVTRQVVVLIIVGPGNRAEWDEPTLVQLRFSSLLGLPKQPFQSRKLKGFNGVIFSVKEPDGHARIAPYNKQGREEYAGSAAQENYYDFANEYEDYQYLHSAPIVSKNYDPFWTLMILDVFTIMIFVVVVCMMFLCLFCFVGYYHYNKSQKKESLTYAPQQQV